MFDTSDGFIPVKAKEAIGLIEALMGDLEESLSISTLEVTEALNKAASLPENRHKRLNDLLSAPEVEAKERILRLYQEISGRLIGAKRSLENTGEFYRQIDAERIFAVCTHSNITWVRSGVQGGIQPFQKCGHCGAIRYEGAKAEWQLTKS